MLHSLARNWWALLLRGIAAVLFGILAFSVPGATIFALVILFGAYAFIDGVFAIASAVRAAEAHQRWWPLVFEGVVGLAIAAVTLFQPHITAFALYITIAVWAFLTGVFEIVAAIQLRKAIAGEVLLIVSGVLSIVFAALLVTFPQFGALTIVYIIGAYAVIFGVLMIGLGLRLRGHASHPH